MDDDTTFLWRHHGASLVWDPDALEEAARDGGTTVSLRQVLAWTQALPDDPPGGCRTVIVTGLQTALDTLDPADADALLRGVRTVVRQQMRHWPEAALVFAVSDRTRYVVSPPSGSVLMRSPDRRIVDIGVALWGGAARDASRLVVTRTDGRGQETRVPIGYWLRRAS